MNHRSSNPLTPDNHRLYLNTFAAISAGLMALCVVFVIVNPASQASIVFRNSHDVFMDFFNTVYYSVDCTPYTWGDLSNHNYLPLTYVLFAPIAALYPYYDMADMSTSYPARHHQTTAIACFVFLFLSFVLFFYLLNCKMECNRRHKWMLTAVLFLSSPVVFCIDRANTIVLATALTFVFLMTYKSERKLACHLGYVCLAIAAALKIFPAVFGILLLKEKKFKDAIFTVLYGLFFAFAPFFLLQGGFVENVKLFFVALYEHALAYADGSFGFSAAWLGYAFFGLAIGYVFVHKQSDWKLYLVLFFAYFLTSGQQSFYCIIMIFYPLVLFFNERHHKKAEILYLLFFVLLLTPLQYGFLFPSLGITNFIITNLLCVVMYTWLLVEEAVTQLRNRVVTVI